MHEILGFMGENAFEILGNLLDLLLAVSDGPSPRPPVGRRQFPGTRGLPTSASFDLRTIHLTTLHPLR
jgi:hypothetical protein